MQKMSKISDTIHTLFIVLSLRNTINVNGILYGIRRLPIIGKLISDRIYGFKIIKIFALLMSLGSEITKAFGGKLLFMLTLLLGAGALSSYNDYPGATIFLYAFLLLSIFGAFMHTFFAVGTEVEYGVFMLGMDAGDYIRAIFTYKCFTIFTGYVLFGIPAALIAHVPWFITLLIPVAGVGFKAANLAVQTTLYSAKISQSKFDRKGRRITVFNSGLCVLIGCSVFFVGMIAAPLVFFWNDLFIIPAAGVILACLSIIPSYFLIRRIPYGTYRTALFAEKARKEVVKKSSAKAIKKTSVAQINESAGITSGAKGYKFLNELFIKRHRKMLWGTVSYIVIGTVIAIIVASAIIYVELVEFHGAPKEAIVRGLFTQKLSAVPFLMYFMNRGAQISQTMFANCDSSLLMFGFYKTPKSILTMFKLRIMSMIKLNFVPALMLATYAVAVIAITGGEDYRFQYLFTFLSIILTMMFFSVHHLAIYYLLQPYTSDFKVKSKTYSIINASVYALCWFLFNHNVSAEIFAPAAAAFTILYIVIACVLVYKYAPKTFRIR